MSEFTELVAEELERIRGKHGPIAGAHEGLGVLLEEFDEFKAEVYRRRLDREAMLSELVQVAAVAQRIAEDLELLIHRDTTPPRPIGFGGHAGEGP